MAFKTSKRPLLRSIKDQNEMLSFVNKHLFERNTFYSKANYTIKTSKRDVSKTCEEILKILKKDSC